jgi:hypothetical protein
LALSGGATALYLWWGRRHGRELDSLGPFTMSPRWNIVIWAGSAVAAVPTRNWRSPGYRKLGLRRVDVRTGGPLSVRNVLARELFVMASRLSVRQLSKPWRTRRQRRVENMQLELGQVRRAHADDSDAQQEAMKEVFKRHHLNPAGSCAPALAGPVLMHAPLMWSPLNQTVAERVAGIVVVQE